LVSEVIRAAEFCFAFVLRIVPRRHRFDAALLLARVTVPLFRLTAAYQEQEIKRFHSPREIALHLLLNALSKNRTPFDLRITANGYEHFARAYARGKGVLVIGHHAALTVLMVRLFHDRGLDPIVITPDVRLRVAGTLMTARTLQPSATFLVKLRGSLRKGELVCGMPDRGEHHARRTVEFATATGQVILAPAMIQVAARCGAEVLFTEVHTRRRQLVATIATPSAASSGHAEAITEDFISFVQQHTAMRRTSELTHASGLRSPTLTNKTAAPGEVALATTEVD
jgi:hypothetical protein